MRIPSLCPRRLGLSLSQGKRLLFWCLPISLLAIFSFLNISIYGQADVASSRLEGKVMDVNGSPVAGASLTIIDKDRGIVRIALSDREGRYRVQLLKPGRYDLRIEAAGFETQVLTGIVLTVGQIGVRDIQLQVGTISTEINVSASPTLVDPARTQQSDTIERRQIERLPNLSRNFTSYISTLPGVADVSAARVQQSRVFNVPTSGFSIGAGNGRSNYVSIDGGENDSGTGNLRIRNLSIEMVQEFQVNRNAFSAEYGFTASTAVNVVTQSGTNTFHGSGYIFYRSQRTSARDPLNLTSIKPFEQRISPGFTFDGPIVEKRAFFFTSFEALKYDVARLRSYTGTVSILGLTGPQSTYVQTLTTGPNATDNTRRIGGILQAALATTNYPSVMQLLKQSEGEFDAPTRTYNWTTHFDYDRSDHDLFSGRYTLALENIDLLGAANIEAPSNGTLQKAHDNTVVGTWTHIFNEHLFNQLRVQFADDDYKQLSRSPNSTQLVIAGLITYGRIATVPFIIDQKRYQFEDALTFSRGREEFKIGASYRPVNALIITEIGTHGTYQFAAGQPLTNALSSSDVSILSGPLAPPNDATLTSIQAFDLGLPSIWQQGFGNTGFRAWQQNFGTFGQVSWKALPRLTINLGARLNYDGEPQPLDKNVSVSPRVGFAWDPFGKGRTVIRGGFGTFVAPVSLNIILSATLQSDNGRFINLQSRTLADGAQSTRALWAYGVSLGRLPFAALSEADVRAFGIIPAPGQPNRRVADAAADYDNPYSVQASLGFSQELPHGLAIDLAFQMYHGVHLPIALEGNYRESGQFVTVPGMPGSDLFGPRLERIDPNIAQKIVHSSEGNSIYYGMNASLIKRFGERAQFRASYSYSKALDDTTDFNGSLTPYLPTRRYLDRGLSSYDLRNVFVASGSFESPYRAGAGNEWWQQILAYVTLSPIVTLRNGFPFNLFIGRDVNGDLNTSDRPFHAPRNSGIGPNFYSTDIRLSKLFYLTNAEHMNIEFTVEAVNIFNRTNFLRVNDVVCGTTVQPGFINGCDPKFLNGPFDFHGVAGLPPSSPLAFTAAGPARQIQFGVKLNI